MACSGAPFTKRTKNRASLFHIWSACLACGCEKCSARNRLEARKLGGRPETLGNTLVADGFRPPRVRWRGGIKAAVQREVTETRAWDKLADKLNKDREPWDIQFGYKLRERFGRIPIAKKFHEGDSPWRRRWMLRLFERQRAGIICPSSNR